MFGARKRGSNSLEEPKNGRKKWEGEKCYRTLADAPALLLNNKNTAI
jgi:hypothetical protein